MNFYRNNYLNVYHFSDIVPLMSFPFVSKAIIRIYFYIAIFSVDSLDSFFMHVEINLTWVFIQDSFA